MLIKEVISSIKKYHKGSWMGHVIEEKTTRDQVLYGSVDRECTGIVTTCFASVDVIRKAAELGANLIISHEALFWNHGDHTDWLVDNKVFQAKKALLDETGITVWRNHDYIHSGIPLADGTYTDGIFYGVMQELGWEKYLIYNKEMPMVYQLPDVPVTEVANHIMTSFNLNGIRIIGDRSHKVNKLAFIMHVIGGDDNKILSMVEENGIDTAIAMELTDFTFNEYVRDSAMLQMPKTILAVGHFNTEEPGMKYMLNWLPQAIGQAIPQHFVQSGDAFGYLPNERKNHDNH